VVSICISLIIKDVEDGLCSFVKYLLLVPTFYTEFFFFSVDL
jgi:hypothetical protein